MSQVTVLVGVVVWATIVGYVHYLLTKNKYLKSAICFLLVAIIAGAFFVAKFSYLFQNSI
jgi:hypothetical protein